MPSTILCVDDDRHYSQILARAFEREGYRVVLAHDGDDALLKARQCKPQLITLDVMLPKRDGFEVLASLRKEEESAQTPVLLVSGCTLTEDYEDRASALSANALLRKPVPLDQLLSLVRGQISSGKSLQGNPTSKDLEGNLEDLPVAVLLHQMHGLRATGVLQIKHGKKRKDIQLREGVPVAVRSNLMNETLGHLLLASGKITEDVLHESLLRVKSGEGLHGQILQAMHMLDEEDLSLALRRQASKKILEAFRWEKGKYRFREGVRLRGANTLSLKKSPARLIWKGVLDAMPMAQIERFLQENGHKALVSGESPYYAHQDIDLSEDAQRWLHQADGSVPLGVLCPQLEKARRELYALIVLELLELREPATRRKLSRRPRKIREIKRHVQEAEERAEAGERYEDEIRRELTEMAAQIEKQDCFEVLGVDRRANDEEIRAAYARLAKKTHPDRFTGSSEALLHVAQRVFGVIAKAYDEIEDREKRMIYLRRCQENDALQRELEIGQRAVQAELDFQKGESALKAGAIGTALEHFERATKTYPEEGEYLAHYGWTWYLSKPQEPGRAKKAVAIVKKGLSLAPEREKPYLFLGRLCLARDRADIAEKMFMRAVQYAPDSVEALRELRLIDMRREKSKGFMKKILRRA